MTSPYLQNLRTAIQNARALEEQLTLRAEYAGLLARYGSLRQARQEIDALRKANSAYSPVVTAAILIAEGQLAHFMALAPEALGSFRAAHAIAATAGLSDIAAVALAWMAASEYVSGAVTRAASHAMEVLQSSGPAQPSCLSRAHLVIADSLSCAGLDTAAAGHYVLARRFASEDGDISMQSVVLFNAAAFAVAGLTHQDCLEANTATRLRGVELQLLSIANLDAGIGLSSLSAMVPLLQAECLTVARRWEDAVSRYSSVLERARQQGQDRWLAKYLAGAAYCLAQSRKPEQALAKAATAIEHLQDCTDADNRAVAHSRLAKAFALTGREDLGRAHTLRAASEFAAHRESQGILREELEKILSVLPATGPTRK